MHYSSTHCTIKFYFSDPHFFIRIWKSFLRKQTTTTKQKRMLVARNRKMLLRSSKVKTPSLLTNEQRIFRRRRLNELKCDARDRLKKLRACNGGKPIRGDILQVVNEINALSKKLWLHRNAKTSSFKLYIEKGFSSY